MLDARDVTPPPRFEVKTPTGAPNVIMILIDDMGLGIPSVFGGPVHMPNAEKLAAIGIRYNQFHTTALCSPIRAALLTGRNHHMNKMGSITETATTIPATQANGRTTRSSGGNLAPKRLQHRYVWEESRDGSPGGQSIWSD